MAIRPPALNAGVASEREDGATGSRESVNSAERSVFDIRDRRTLSEDSLALSAISDSTADSFSGEGGDGPFVPAMSDAANDARAGDDATRQPDADKGEGVPAMPLAASLPEIDAWRTAASPSDDKTGATPPFQCGEPSPMGAGNGNSFPSLTDAGNANEYPSRASEDSAYLTLVNDDNAGVIYHPVSDGRDSGSFSPSEAVRWRRPIGQRPLFSTLCGDQLAHDVPAFRRTNRPRSICSGRPPAPLSSLPSPIP